MKDGKRSFAKNSMIIGALSRFSDFLRNRFDESFFGWLLCGNYRHEENGIIGLAGEKLKIRQRITVPFKRFNARAFENSLILRKTGEMFRKIPDVQFKYAGIFVFAFGLYTAISCLIKNFGAAIAGQSFYTLYLGVICAAIGGIISTSQKRLSETVAGSRILSFLIFRVLGIKPAAVSGTGKSRGRGDVSFVSGIVLGLISEITSPFAALLAIPVSALAFAVLAVPECGAVCVILAFPFLGMRQLALLCAFVTAAWLLKLMRGKRTVSTSSLDIAVLAFAAVMLAGGLVSVTREESMRYALYFICFMSGYFIAVNLIRTSEWFYRCISALVFSFSLTVIAGTVSAVGSPGLAGIPFLQTAAQKLRQRNYKIGRKILETAPVKALFPDALEEFRRSHGSADYNSATPVMRQTLVNTVNEDLVEYMPNMKMPVLLVWGENDDATPLSDAKIMEQLMPDAGLVTLKNCGHYSFLEQQFTFNKVLASFMEID